MYDEFINMTKASAHLLCVKTLTATGVEIDYSLQLRFETDDRSDGTITVDVDDSSISFPDDDAQGTQFGLTDLKRFIDLIVTIQDLKARALTSREVLLNELAHIVDYLQYMSRIHGEEVVWDGGRVTVLETGE